MKGTMLRLTRNCVASLILIAVSLLLVTWTAPVAHAQTLTGYADTLAFFKNYFVTGDYVVGGVGLRGQGDGSGYATNYIQIQGVPSGATVVSAFLYWEAIEATDTASTMNGYFQGYPIVGAQPSPLAHTPPCWSSGGGTGSSNGSKHLRVYRADVAPYLVVNGQYQTNTPAGSPGYQVRLQDSGSNGAGTPLTEGASLVIIYRTLTDPLRSVVLYDGSWTMNNATPYMSQTIQWFYQASGGQAKLTHIVGDAQANFGETETFFGGAGTQTVQNPFYGSAGYSWDNVTFAVNVAPNASQVATDVLPNSSACLSWGALVFSTPVVNTNGDGLLDVWKELQGYWEKTPGSTDPQAQTWVALPGANTNPLHSSAKDLFVQVDYMTDPTGVYSKPPGSPHSHLPKLQALDTIATAFGSHGINVHFDVGANYQGLGKSYIVPFPIPNDPNNGVFHGGNAILETDPTATCSTGAGCDFPFGTYGVPGVVTWKTGVTYNKYQFFQHGRKDSYHYVLMGHALGLPAQTWSVPDVTLSSISVNASQVATVTTSSPHGLTNGTLVTISGAIGSDSLNGDYTIQNAGGNSFTVTTSGVAPGVYGYFPNQQLGLMTTPNGVLQSNEPNLTVSTGAPLSISGFSDLGGGDSLVTLGLWKADDPVGCQWDPSVPGASSYCNNQVGSVTVQAGTIMHEIGHTLYLTHGGYYRDPNPDLTGFGQNCKPNFQSVMNYLFQIRGLPSNQGLFSTDPPKIDYSGQTLFPGLDENTLVESAGMGKDGAALPAYGARWYGPPSVADAAIESKFPGTHLAKQHCDGTPLNGEQVVRIDAATVNATNTALVPIDWNNNGMIDTATNIDLNFDGFLDPSTQIDPITGQPFTTVPLGGFNDWANLYLQQIGARRNIGGFSTDITALDLGAGSGGSKLLGGGSKLLGGGSDLINGGSKLLGGGSKLLGGGSKLLGGGSKLLGGGLEVDFDTANATVDPPVGVSATQSLTLKSTVIVTWNPPGFGQIRAYYVWRANISKAPMSAMNPPVLLTTTPLGQNTFTYLDNTVKSNQMYLYFVVSALGSESGPNAGNQSGPSNFATVTVH